MKWITRERVKVDRVACPWLIRRCIDPRPEFIFLPRDTGWSAIREGSVFGVAGCEPGHPGKTVGFDAIPDRDELRDPALRLLAELVRAADSSPSRPHLAGPGPRWIAHGFSAPGFTDHELLEREFPIYDALYAACHRQVGPA